MLKFTHQDINNDLFHQALRKLYRSNGMDSKVAYRVGKIAARVDKEVQWITVEAINLHKKYCKLDDTGEPKGMYQGKLEFDSPEVEKEHDEKFQELMKKEIDEKVLPIPLSAIPNGVLSPAELNAISCLLDEESLEEAP